MKQREAKTTAQPLNDDETKIISGGCQCECTNGATSKDMGSYENAYKCTNACQAKGWKMLWCN